MTAGALQALTSVQPELVASGLGFPEGPVAMPDGSFVCVDSYRGQLTILGADRVARPLTSTGGAPNSCVVGADGVFYVCQNGGTTGPWRAAEMIEPSIQVVEPGGKAEAVITEVEGIKLNGPNDLCFARDGSLIFSDPAPITLQIRIPASYTGSYRTASHRFWSHSRNPFSQMG